MNVGFIGCGNMGSALASAISRVKGTNVYIYDINTEKSKEVANRIGAEIMPAEKIASSVDFLFLAVKPNMARATLEALSEPLSKARALTVVSMLAGVKLESLLDMVPKGVGVIRIMPNTSVAIGKGVTAYAVSEGVGADREAAFLEIMSKTGLVDKLPESQIDAESALAGSGPAFAYMFIEALADGAVAAGLPRERAQLYAATMLEGAARTLLESGEHPGSLKDKVCSPGGSTIEGVMTLEASGFRSAVSEAVVKTCEKAKRLG